jgi:hypothetical protein
VFVFVPETVRKLPRQGDTLKGGFLASTWARYVAGSIGVSFGGFNERVEIRFRGHSPGWYEKGGADHYIWIVSFKAARCETL